ncbi:hypothetical protein FLONG3_10575 [Fusarium longipes]|uniref:Uncharacterized protein n=1 Tax=Fusarium longipes TaxID=694270 RepID=A0A395RMM7_9HYPO|nr:hypothetical protein FLONG3_10575 [Fusarium longipes]
MEQMAFAKLKNHFSDMLKWRKAIWFIRRIVFTFLTFTYSGAYKHHTRVPIQAIVTHQDYNQDKAKTIEALAQFRLLKAEELRFVQGAATLSGAAAIGVFSWPTTEKAIWATKMFWNWGLFCSIFALISSAHQRLLRYLPDKVDQEFGAHRLEVALSLFLQPPCPTMLMSYSWVFFVTGYALHLLTPVFGSSRAKSSEETTGIWRDFVWLRAGCSQLHILWESLSASSFNSEAEVFDYKQRDAGVMGYSFA